MGWGFHRTTNQRKSRYLHSVCILLPEVWVQNVKNVDNVLYIKKLDLNSFYCLMSYSFLHFVSFDPHSPPLRARLVLLSQLCDWWSDLHRIAQLINVRIRLSDSWFRVLSYKILPICNFSIYFSRFVCKAPKLCLLPSPFLAPTFILQIYIW